MIPNIRATRSARWRQKANRSHADYAPTRRRCRYNGSRHQAYATGAEGLEMFERIIVPLDGSKLAEQALPYATSLAREYGGKLFLVRVVGRSATSVAMAAHSMSAGPSLLTAELLQETIDSERAEAEEYVKRMLTRVRRARANGEAEVREGSPTAEIIDCAMRRRASVIVISSHGRGGIGRVMFGSIADQVLRSSTFPVLVIRAKAKVQA